MFLYLLIYLFILSIVIYLQSNFNPATFSSTQQHLTSQHHPVASGKLFNNVNVGNNCCVKL